MPTTAAAARSGRQPSLRSRLFIALGAIVLLAAIAWTAWWLVIGQNHVATDNAYVGADVGDITPLVSGPIIQVLAADTQAVKAGQTLVVIDPTDFQIALAQADAQLGQARRKVQGYFANQGALSGQVAAREADIIRADSQIDSARSDLDRAKTELGRRQRLSASGAVSGDELTQAENQFHTAEAALASANAGRIQAVANRGAAVGSKDVNSALIAGGPVEANPEVAAALANVSAARTTLVAHGSGGAVRRGRGKEAGCRRAARPGRPGPDERGAGLQGLRRRQL